MGVIAAQAAVADHRRQHVASADVRRADDQRQCLE